MKVKAYQTWREAKPEQLRLYYKNELILTDIINQSAPLVRNAGRSLRNLRHNDSEKEKTAVFNQLEEALSQVGIGQEITLLSKLYNCSHGYAVELSYIENFMGMDGYFKTIEELVEVSRQEVQKAFPTLFGARVLPFFYTILEPSNFSEEEKQQAKAMYGYERMARTEQRDFMVQLESYVEYGLGPEERQDFEKQYARFFN